MCVCVCVCVEEEMESQDRWWMRPRITLNVNSLTAAQLCLPTSIDLILLVVTNNFTN